MPYKDPEKQREYQRQWRSARRAQYFSGKLCARCGAADNLELDHKDPAVKVTHVIWSWSAKRRESELAKCQPLCSACHKAKTREQFVLQSGACFENKLKTHCKRGHEFTEENTYLRPNGRECRTCERARKSQPIADGGSRLENDQG